MAINTDLKLNFVEKNEVQNIFDKINEQFHSEMNSKNDLFHEKIDYFTKQIIYFANMFEQIKSETFNELNQISEKNHRSNETIKKNVNEIEYKVKKDFAELNNFFETTVTRLDVQHERIIILNDLVNMNAISLKEEIVLADKKINEKIKALKKEAIKYFVVFNLISFLLIFLTLK